MIIYIWIYVYITIFINMKSLLSVFSLFFVHVFTYECLSPFVSEDLKCAETGISKSELKVYTSTLVVVSKNGSSFEESPFIESLSMMYNETLQGFKSINILSQDSLSSNQHKVKYETLYVYNILRSQSTNKIIEATIKNITYIDAYLWSSETFNNSYKVNLSEGLTVTENSLCGKTDCLYGTVCTENGIELCCQSVCCTSEYCYNGGVCFHNKNNSSPSCSCRVYTTSGFVGDQCKTYLHIWMLIVVSILFGLCIICTVIWFSYSIFKLNKRTYKEIREEIENKKKNSTLDTKENDLYTKTKTKLSSLYKTLENKIGRNEQQSLKSNSKTKLTRNISDEDKFDEVSCDDVMSIRPPVPAPRRFLPISRLPEANTAERFQNDEKQKFPSDINNSTFSEDSSYKTETLINKKVVEKSTHLYDEVPQSETSYCYADEVATISQSVISCRDFVLDEVKVTTV